MTDNKVFVVHCKRIVDRNVLYLLDKASNVKTRTDKTAISKDDKSSGIRSASNEVAHKLIKTFIKQHQTI